MGRLSFTICEYRCTRSYKHRQRRTYNIAEEENLVNGTGRETEVDRERKGGDVRQGPSGDLG